MATQTSGAQNRTVKFPCGKLITGGLRETAYKVKLHCIHCSVCKECEYLEPPNYNPKNALKNGKMGMVRSRQGNVSAPPNHQLQNQIQTINL